jgi:hypothetical protein
VKPGENGTGEELQRAASPVPTLFLTSISIALVILSKRSNAKCIEGSNIQPTCVYASLGGDSHTRSLKIKVIFILLEKGISVSASDIVDPCLRWDDMNKKFLSASAVVIADMHGSFDLCGSAITTV